MIIEITSTDKNIGTATSRINPTGSGKFTLDGVKLTTESGTAIFVEYGYEGEDGKKVPVIPEIVINNSTINAAGAYAVSTNASIKQAEGATADRSVMATDPVVKITISNSTLTAGVDYNALTGAYTSKSATDGTALFINVPSDVTVDGSTLVANHQTVMVRGGELEMSDSTVKLVKMTDTDDSLTMAWGEGNTAPRAAMLLGHKNSTDKDVAYQYKTTVILDNVKFDVDTADRTVVIASDYSADTLKTIAKNDGLKEGEVPVMVYFDGGNCVNDKQIDFVDGYDKGTIQLIDCGDASGIY